MASFSLTPSMSHPASKPTARGSTLSLTLSTPADRSMSRHTPARSPPCRWWGPSPFPSPSPRPAPPPRPGLPRGWWAARTRPNSTARIFRKTACCIIWLLKFESVGCAVQPSPTLRGTPTIAGARKATAPAPSASQFCIEHLRERVRGLELGAPRGAVVGGATKVSDRQRRRPAMQADGVAEAQMKWSARRAAPSVRALNACCIRNCWGGGGQRQRTE